MSNYGTPAPPFSGYQPPFGYQQAGYSAAPSSPPLASWIQRVLAYLVDYALSLPFFIAMVLFLPHLGSTQVNGVAKLTLTGGNWSLVFLMYVLSLAFGVYNRYYLGGQGQSIGKKALGLTLVAESTGQPIGMGMAFVRDLAHGVDGLMCDIGFLFPLWDEKRQTIADKMVGTLVIVKA